MIKKVLLVYLVSVLSVYAQEKYAEISSDFMVIDFGKVEQNKQVYDKFEIYNEGNDTLRITAVNVSSFSVQTRLFNKVIAPHDSTELYIQYNPDVREREQMEYITVLSNSKNNPSFQLTVKAFINVKELKVKTDANVPEIYFPSMTYDFGVVKKGEVKFFGFKFINKGKTTLKITNLKSSCGCTAAIMSSNEIPSGGEGLIKVEFDSTTQLGKTRRSVRVTSNDPLKQKTYLNIYADVIE